MPLRGNITVQGCACYCVCFTVSINIERRRAWLQSAGSYQRGVNIFCVFFLLCSGDKEMGDSPAVAERLSQVTRLSLNCRHRQISCKLNTIFHNTLFFLHFFLNGLQSCTFHKIVSYGVNMLLLNRC